MNSIFDGFLGVSGWTNFPQSPSIVLLVYESNQSNKIRIHNGSTDTIVCEVRTNQSSPFCGVPTARMSEQTAIIGIWKSSASVTHGAHELFSSNSLHGSREKTKEHRSCCRGCPSCKEKESTLNCIERDLFVGIETLLYCA